MRQMLPVTGGFDAPRAGPMGRLFPADDAVGSAYYRFSDTNSCSISSLVVITLLFA
jgi:hypothetical protein